MKVMATAALARQKDSRLLRRRMRTWDMERRKGVGEKGSEGERE
jgi:hypothetical protein